MKSKLSLVWLIAAGCLLLTGCNYEVPLTAKPTRPVDERLLWSWVTVDKETKKEEVMIVQKLDEATYVVAFDGSIYRAFHSDFAGTAFVSVQELGNERKYTYLTYRLSANGGQLSLRTVSTKVIPEKTQGREALQKLIKDNLSNPALLGDELLFTKKKG